MSEDNGAVVAASTEVAEENAGAKEAIYEKVSEFVKAKTGKRIGKSGGQELFNIVVAEIFAATAREGSFRFNGGFGSMHIKTYQPGTRRLPSGQSTTFGEREKARYEEGVVVRALIKNHGNLDEALKVRGSREAISKALKPVAQPPVPKAPVQEGSDVDLV